MHEYIFLLPIFIFLLLGVMSPGPSFILVAHTAMRGSRSEAIAVSVGMGVGAVIFALIASVGLFVLLDSAPWLYLGLKVLGGAYLCLLAVRIWKNSTEPMVDNSTQAKSKRGIAKMFLTGLITQLSNPKTAIVFGSAFAAFMPKDVPEYSYYLISISVFMIDSIWYILVATLLSTSKAQNTYIKFKKYICRASSGLMGVMGIKLITS
ncbi:LysE family translocator [Shewanella sp. VB17]|uniref:LysE family translocator n=1 Tax=Shewanella sp. VB17 TaxID=2739432 RepID=UPI00156385B6|nr:LysE family translocator [Shewanella sp. VB17]NRD75270.1 LysE family translocator [Shewanella sp. VB17]